MKLLRSNLNRWRQKKRGGFASAPLCYLLRDPRGICFPHRGQVITAPLIFLPQLGHLVITLLEGRIVKTTWTGSGEALSHSAHPLGARLHPVQALVADIFPLHDVIYFPR